MADSRGTNDKSNRSNCSESYNEYLNRAAGACEAGDLVLGMHLYLAAYERAVVDPDIPDGMAIAGLREAWNLACDLKERSMAEYVFEKLEPFLTSEEIAICANKLQSLALDRLEEYGFSREELEGMAEMISQDLMGGEGSVVKVESIAIPNVAAAAGFVVDANGEGSFDDLAEVPGEAVDSEIAEWDDGPEGDSEQELSGALEDSSESHAEAEIGSKPKGRPEKVGLGSASADFNPYDYYETSSVGTSYHAATNDGSGSYVFTRDKQRAAESGKAREREAQGLENPLSQADTAAGKLPSVHGLDAQGERSALSEAKERPGVRDGGGVLGSASAKTSEASDQGKMNVPAHKGELGHVAPPPGVPAKSQEGDMPTMPDVAAPGAPVFNYKALVGYNDAITAVRELGVGLERDGGFRNFIKMMNARHGLDRMPAVDTLLFRAPIVEDATRFVDATIGEIGLPVLRMCMEEGMQGAPMLCVSTYGDSRPRMNHAHNRFDGPAILVLDDLDMWVMPQVPENVEGIAGFVMANMSRGAREAINMIRSAVEDPDVYVLATASSDGEVDPFFYEVLEPITIVDITYPTENERDDIWREIMRDHPSLRTLDRRALVKLSADISRYDLYMAARSAIEEAYKAGLVQRTYLPVTAQNILDKLAAYQPLESDAYQAIEDEIVRGFREEIEGLESLLDEPLE